jgi:O-antigen ligase
LMTQQWMFYLLPMLLVAGIFFLHDIRIPFYALIASLPVSFNLQEQFQIGLDFPDEPLMLLLTGIFLFFVALNYQRINFREWLRHPLVVMILISFLWMVITVIFSQDTMLSAKYMLKRIWYLIPFFFFPLLFFRDAAMIRRAFLLLFIPLTLLIIVVLYRYRALGFRFEDVHDPVTPFFQNHVMYGSMLSCVVPLVAGAVYMSRIFSTRWLVLLGTLILFLVAVYFSYSRAAWMAVIFAAGAMVCIRLKVMHWAMLAFYVLILSAVLWLSNQNHYLNYRPKFEKTIMHESLSDHIMATVQGTDISSAERYYRWIAAIRMSVDHPLTGVGPNNFYTYYKAYTIAAYRTWVSRNLERSTTHNYFLFMLVEQGYPGMVLYAALILIIFWYGQRVYHRQKQAFQKVAVLSSLCLIAAVFINNFFSELLETDKIGSLFLLALAVIVAIDIQEKSGSTTAKDSLV